MKFIARNIFLLITILALIACVVLLFINVETAKKAMGVAMITFSFHIFYFMIVGTKVDKKEP